MTAMTTPTSPQPSNRRRATITRQSPAASQIDLFDDEASLLHYEWEGAEPPAGSLAYAQPSPTDATVSATGNAGKSG